jgi:AraC-like DNA-binding protein
MPLPLRHIRAGVDRIPAGSSLPRHRHIDAYVTVILAGAYVQAAYAGRLAVRAGDILLQPTMDCHCDVMKSRGVELLRLHWSWTPTYGGIYRGADVEAIRRAAERGDGEAEHLLGLLFSRQKPVTTLADWEDALALRLRDSEARVSHLAEELGLTREAVSRGFAKAYGVSPAVFRSELRARAAWLKIRTTQQRLCDIAADTGFADQPHMTRAISQMTGASPTHWRTAHRPLHESRALNLRCSPDPK